MERVLLVFSIALILAAGTVVSCHHVDGFRMDDDAGTDGDADGDTDADADGDTDADSDADADGDADADTDSDVDTVPCDEISPYCCTDACPCEDDFMSDCVPTAFGGELSMFNVCMQQPDPGECWSVLDCYDGQFCEDYSPCPCDMECFAEWPGECVPASMEQCDSTIDLEQCEPGYYCMPLGEAGDLCHHLPDGFECWYDSDCDDGQYCNGETICGFYVNCLSKPGLCKVI